MANVERHDFFPTCLYRFKHSFQDNELNQMVKHIEDNSLVEKNKQIVKITGSQPQNELHKINTFANLTKTITDVTKTVLEEQEYMGEIEITNMWGNILRPQSQRAHAPHTHSNNILSGVYYLQSGSPIQFFDPRPAATILKPRNTPNWDNSGMIQFDSVEDIALFFPSWLMHWVPSTSKERASIAWNVIVRGEYGEPHSLQNAYI